MPTEPALSLFLDCSEKESSYCSKHWFSREGSAAEAARGKGMVRRSVWAQGGYEEGARGLAPPGTGSCPGTSVSLVPGHPWQGHTGGRPCPRTWPVLVWASLSCSCKQGTSTVNFKHAPSGNRGLSAVWPGEQGPLCSHLRPCPRRARHSQSWANGLRCPRDNVPLTPRPEVCILS